MEGDPVGKTTAGRYAEKVALFDKLVATIPGVERKGATMPYTAINGNMFSVLDKTGTLALRLPAGELEAFMKRYETTRSRQYGIVRPEYADVPDALLTKTKTLKKYFDISFSYARTLRPRATTKKK